MHSSMTESLREMVDNEIVACAHPSFDKIEPCSSPIRIYIQNYNNCYDHNYVTNGKTDVKDFHVHEIDIFIIIG